MSCKEPKTEWQRDGNTALDEKLDVVSELTASAPDRFCHVLTRTVDRVFGKDSPSIVDHTMTTPVAHPSDLPS